jgi:hypothetical protein
MKRRELEKITLRDGLGTQSAHSCRNSKGFGRDLSGPGREMRRRARENEERKHRRVGQGWAWAPRAAYINGCVAPMRATPHTPATLATRHADTYMPRRPRCVAPLAHVAPLA